jgi:ribosomal-protein-alanine N-acetyltransferase
VTRPTAIVDGPLTIRPLKLSDESVWLKLRSDNRAWLEPWEANNPPQVQQRLVSFAGMVRRERRQWRARSAFPFVIQYADALVGRVSVSGLQWGAECGGSIGYWIAQSFAGQGIVPRAVALAADFSFQQGVHRLEIAVRPENAASLAVPAKLGFREEGLRERYLFIDHDWRDHRVFALTADDPRQGPLWPSVR